MRGTAKGQIKHEAKLSALLVTRPFSSAVTCGNAQTSCAISNQAQYHDLFIFKPKTCISHKINTLTKQTMQPKVRFSNLSHGVSPGWYSTKQWYCSADVSSYCHIFCTVC